MSQGKILVVDNEPAIIDEFERAIKRSGYSVDTAFSGEEGWEKCKNNYYDVVITDWKMGKMSGLELARKIDTEYPVTKIIIITAFGLEFETVVENDHYRPFDYFRKPVDMNDFVQKLNEAVQRKDGVISALEEWVLSHPEESDRPMKATLSDDKDTHIWSARNILEEIRRNTERGRAEYEKLIQLTIDLLTRQRIK